MDEAIQSHSGAHILVVVCPLQGHTAALIRLSHRITELGAKVTLLTMNSLPTSVASGIHGIRIVSIPSGIELETGWKNQEKLLERVDRVVPGYLEDLLKRGDGISGVVFDTPLAWMVGIPKKMGLKSAVFWCSCAGCLAVGFKIPQLIDSQIIDNDGAPLKEEIIKLLPNMPEMTTTDLMWYFPGDKDLQKAMFHVIKGMVDHMTNADWILGNWFHELDPLATNLSPNILSIGPLLAHGRPSGSFCSEDPTCLSWLDKQAQSSVVYVAFGSTSRFSPQQLDELAIGLELLGRPFLWVAWSGLTNGLSSTYSAGFRERVGDRGKMVEWAPQEAVLGHPSLACFITHCGWNSFLESLSMGVPMLCWPYFGDQMYAESCICDAWKVGLRLRPNESGLVSRNEIGQKVEELLSDGMTREKALEWKRMAGQSLSKGGSSYTNLEYLIHQMKS